MQNTQNMFHRNLRNDLGYETPLESKLNMYERQIDQLFDFSYRDQENIQSLFKMKDNLEKSFDQIKTQFNDTQIDQLRACITNYYHLELENKRRLENSECYQFQLFILQIFIISYLIYIRF